MIGAMTIDLCKLETLITFLSTSIKINFFKNLFRLLFPHLKGVLDFLNHANQVCKGWW